MLTSAIQNRVMSPRWGLYCGVLPYYLGFYPTLIYVAPLGLALIHNLGQLVHHYLIFLAGGDACVPGRFISPAYAGFPFSRRGCLRTRAFIPPAHAGVPFRLR